MCNAVSYKENFVESVYANVYIEFKKNLLILNFQTSVTQLATRDTHLCYSGSSLVVTQRWGKSSVYWEQSDILQSDYTGWGRGSNGHSCICLKTISSSTQMHTETPWMLVSQPKLFYNIWSKDSYSNVSPRLETDWNNQIKQVYWSFIMQLFQAWTKIKDETPPVCVQFHPQGHS